jgi:TPP-dependent indolepyruvate ferredoxin oxidoreductase alpha subunit
MTIPSAATGEGILAVTKALLQSGVSYVGGYQGAPVSHLLDVLVEARDCWTSWACMSRPAPTRPAPPPCSAPRSTTRCAAR